MAILSVKLGIMAAQIRNHLPGFRLFRLSKTTCQPLEELPSILKYQGIIEGSWWLRIPYIIRPYFLVDWLAFSGGLGPLDSHRSQHQLPGILQLPRWKITAASPEKSPPIEIRKIIWSKPPFVVDPAVKFSRVV